MTKMESENIQESEFKVESDVANEKKLVLKKKNKRGIVYISQIPKYMNVSILIEMLSKYGEIGRKYLELDKGPEQVAGQKVNKKKKKEASRRFTEGWVEFKKKKVAKFVAATLNNQQISTRKRSKFYDCLWNIKYLRGFKWTHLNERLAYERQVHKSRLTTEISQAKREVNFFSYNVDRSKKLRSKMERGEKTTFVAPEVRQRDTDMEIRRAKGDESSKTRKEFLKSLLT